MYFFQADAARLPLTDKSVDLVCQCGCGQVLHTNKRFIRGHNSRSQHGSPEKRFWERVIKTNECWIFQNAYRYGHILVEGEIVKAHRFSWELHFGEIPEGMSVLHKCDNPSCVRPDHLFLGTQLTNMEDSKQKGRNAHGEKHPRAIITLSQAREVKTRASKSQKPSDIARDMGISCWAVFKIASGKTWKDA